MRFPSLHAFMLPALLLLAGCAGYDPQMRGDHAAAKYQTDLGRCRKLAAVTAARISGASPQSSIKAVFTSDEPERQDVRTCMQGKGYTLP